MAESRRESGQIGRVVLWVFVALVIAVIAWLIISGSGILPGDTAEGTATSPANVPTAPTNAQ